MTVGNRREAASGALPAALALAAPKIRPDHEAKLFGVGHDGRACAVWPDRREWEALHRYLHNGRDERDFVAIWLEEAGKSRFVRNKSRTLADALDWTRKTIESRRNEPFSLAFYSQNAAGLSRWGCMDFDAHASELEPAWKRAAACAANLKQAAGLCTILEFSGRGYHLWLIAEEFRPVEVWAAIMRQAAATAGVEVAPGVCEIMPSHRSTFGQPVRAPGSWNPATGKCAEIICHDTGPLLKRLLVASPHLEGSSKGSFRRPAFQATPLSGNCDGAATSADVRDIPATSPAGRLPEKGGNGFLLSPQPPTAGMPRSGASEASRDGQTLRLLEKHRIRQVSTRNATLGKLAGELFGQFGEHKARGIARAQYRESLVTLNDAEATHLAEFDRYWQASGKRFRAALGVAERVALDGLSDPARRDAFRILRHWAERAAKDGLPDFPLAVDILGERLGMTRQGATKVRGHLAEAGIIQRTCPHQPRRTAARYVWKLGLK